MKKWWAIPAFLILATVLSGTDIPYMCSGDYDCPDCPDGANRTLITCYVSGVNENPVWRHTETEGETLTCIARDGSIIVKEQTVRCERCTGGTGGGGSGCDPTFPFWWLFCNPFAI